MASGGAVVASPSAATASASDSATRPLFGATREPSQTSTLSAESTYTSPTLSLAVSNSSLTLSDKEAAHSQPLSHATYPEAVDGLGLDDGNSTPRKSTLPLHQPRKQHSFSSSSSSTGTASPTTTILPSTSNSRMVASTSSDDDLARSPTSLGTGAGQVARGGRLDSYPPISEEDDEAREVEKNLERWAAEERQRRKALRASRSGSLLAPPAASALARRLSSLRRNPSSSHHSGRSLGGSGSQDERGMHGEQVPLEELAEEEGGSSSNHSGSYGRRAGALGGGSRRISQGAPLPAGIIRKLNGANGGRESVSSVDSYTSTDALTTRPGIGPGAHPTNIGVQEASSTSTASPNATPKVDKHVGFFEIDGPADGRRALVDLEHGSEGDPASNGTPKANLRGGDRTVASQGAGLGKSKGKGRALEFDGRPVSTNPFGDEDGGADGRLPDDGDVSGVAMSLDPSFASPRIGAGVHSPPQVRVTPDESPSGESEYYDRRQYQSHSLSRSGSSYASSTLPAYAKPKPSALRPIVTVGREAPATLERQRRERMQHHSRASGSHGSFPSIVKTDADAELDAALAAAAGDDLGPLGSSRGPHRDRDRVKRGAGSHSGDVGAYGLQSGGSSYGRRRTPSGRERALGKRRVHRTIDEGDEPGSGSGELDEDEEEEEDDIGEEGEHGPKRGVGSMVPVPKRRSTNDSRFNEVGLDDHQDGDEEEHSRGWALSEQDRRRRRQKHPQREEEDEEGVTAAAVRREEEELRSQRKVWWTEWLCGCGRHAMDEDEQQYGKTNPMG